MRFRRAFTWTDDSALIGVGIPPNNGNRGHGPMTHLTSIQRDVQETGTDRGGWLNISCCDPCHPAGTDQLSRETMKDRAATKIGAWRQRGEWGKRSGAVRYGVGCGAQRLGRAMRRVIYSKQQVWKTPRNPAAVPSYKS